MRPSIFSRVGGQEFFVELVDDFYGRVAGDELLRPMYPVDLEPSKEHLALFLIQHFGGPRVYEALRGDPKLRLRHLGFPIDKKTRDAWMEHMTNALEHSRADVEVRDELRTYFANIATFLMNGGLSLRGN